MPQISGMEGASSPFVTLRVSVIGLSRPQIGGCYKKSARAGENPPGHLLPGSTQDSFDYLSGNIRQPEITPLVAVGEALMVNPHQVHQSGMEVMH